MDNTIQTMHNDKNKKIRKYIAYAISASTSIMKHYYHLLAKNAST